jgi:hypothetical protein
MKPNVEICNKLLPKSGEAIATPAPISLTSLYIIKNEFHFQIWIGLYKLVYEKLTVPIYTVRAPL